MSTALAYALGLEEHTVAIWRTEIEGIRPDRIPCAGSSWRYWPKVREAMLLFLEDWGEAAVANGWTDIALFGVHRAAAMMRVDACGALVTVHPYFVEALAPGAIHFTNGLIARPMTNAAESIPLWSFIENRRRSCSP